MGGSVRGDKCGWIHSFHQESSALIRLGMLGPLWSSNLWPFELTEANDLMRGLMMGVGRSVWRVGVRWKTSQWSHRVMAVKWLHTADFPQGSHWWLLIEVHWCSYLCNSEWHAERSWNVFLAHSGRDQTQDEKCAQKVSIHNHRAGQAFQRIPYKHRFPYSSLPYL